MPAKAKPPRLYLRTRARRTPRWVILDRGKEIDTGASAQQCAEAEKAFHEYLTNKRRRLVGEHHPAAILIAAALTEYAEERGPAVKRKDNLGAAIQKLLEFFGPRPASAVTQATCAEYVRWRSAQRDGRAKRGIRLVKASTARRELVVLSAALRWCWRAGKIDRPVLVHLPPQSEPRERHLTRSEAAALLAGALGWDRDGKRHPARINRHLARFIMLGLYTGTRHDAILKLQWVRNTFGGWIDLDARILYRRQVGAIETGKRRPPLPIPPHLLPHVRRWRRLTACYVIEWHGKPITSQERRAWHQARKMAGLGADVTPHILRHTCATWLLQRGVSLWQVSKVLGTSEDVVRRTYGHHAHDDLRQAVSAFSRKPGRSLGAGQTK
jgi:integrase